MGEASGDLCQEEESVKGIFRQREQHERKRKTQTKTLCGIQLELFGFSQALSSWQCEYPRPCRVFCILEDFTVFLCTVVIIAGIGKSDW